MKQLLIFISCTLLLCFGNNLAAQKLENSKDETVKVKHQNKKGKHQKKGSAMQSSAALDLTKAKQQIKDANSIFSKAMLTGDSATIASLYHREAIVYPADMHTFKSANEMGSMAIAMVGMGIKNFELKSTEVFGSGDLIVESGTFSLGDGSNVVDTGKYIVIWKEEDGSLKMYRDIWNSDGLMTGQ